MNELIKVDSAWTILHLGGMPYFFKRCATTHELFDLLVELRPKLTAAGLAEHVKREYYCPREIMEWWLTTVTIELHLLEYHQRALEYVQFYEKTPKCAFRRAHTLLKFSRPDDLKGYADDNITNDMVTAVFSEYCERTRIEESQEYLRTLGGTLPELSHVNWTIDCENISKMLVSWQYIQTYQKRIGRRYS